MTIHELLAAPCSAEVGRTLVSWASALPGRIVRGDMILGILTADEVELAPRALRKAVDFGDQGALLDLATWLGAPPFGDPDPIGATAVFREAIATGVPNAKLAFAEFLWFRCRDSATPQEQQEAYLMAADAANPGDNSRMLYILGLMTQQVSAPRRLATFGQRRI